ncbi:MAG: hypothetical protein AB1767_12000 [Bacillota bacterium]
MSNSVSKKPAKMSFSRRGGSSRRVPAGAGRKGDAAPRQAYAFFHVFTRGSGMRAVSPVLFVLVIFTLFLPFVTVSCGEYELDTLRAVDMTRREALEDDGSGGRAAVVLLVIIAPAGLIFGLLKGRKGNLGAALAAVAGLALLIAIRVGLNRMLAEQSAAMEIMLTTRFRSGFYLSFMLYLAALFVNVHQLQLCREPRGLRLGK